MKEDIKTYSNLFLFSLFILWVGIMPVRAQGISKSVKPRWGFGINIEPTLSYRILAEKENGDIFGLTPGLFEIFSWLSLSSTNDSFQIRDKEDPTFSLTGNIAVEYVLSDLFTLKLGIGYGSKGYSYNDDIYVNDVNGNPVFYGHLMGHEKKQYVQFPLLVRIDLIKTSFDFFVESGFYYNYFVRYNWNYTMNYNGAIYNGSNPERYKGFLSRKEYGGNTFNHIDGILGVGVERFFRRLGLSLSLNGRYAIISVIREYPYSVGINFCFKYKL